MWSFLRGSRSEPAPQGFDPGQIAEALLVMKGLGAHFALLYANMCGYRSRIIEPATVAEFCSLIEGPPEFTDEGVAFATQGVADDVDLICRSSVFDVSVFGPRGDENAQHATLLRAFRSAVQAARLLALCERSGFDLTDFIRHTAVSRRAADIAAVTAKLEEKRDFLRPLLLRARAEGRNKYGDLDYTQYVAELNEFLGHYFPQGALPFFYHILPLNTAIAYVEGWFQESVDVSVVPMDGREFEHWCAARLREQGWTAQVTQASGDQGIDISVTRGDRTIAIQCKRYTSPIGNKCVQEAHAGMVHYRAEAAFVIGTGGFTPSAAQLAASTGVILLDAENISEFSTLADACLRI